MIKLTKNTRATTPLPIQSRPYDGGDMSVGLEGHTAEEVQAWVSASNWWHSRLPFAESHCYSVLEPIVPGVDSGAVRLPAMLSAASQTRRATLHQHPKKQAGQASPAASGLLRSTKMLASKNIAVSSNSKRIMDRNISKSIDDKALIAPKKEAIQGWPNCRKPYVCSPQRFAMSPPWGAQGSVASMGSKGECDE